MARRLTNEEFLMRVDEVHGDKFVLDKTIYINTRTKLLVTCRTHGDFEIKPDNFLAGQGCAACARDKHKLSILTEERINKLKQLHVNRYFYEDLNVIDGKINITCPKHGIFTQSIHQHEYGHGCTNCALENRKIKRFRTCKVCSKSKTIENFKPKFKTCNECVEKRGIILEKVCKNCGETKPTGDFLKRNDSVDGFRSQCKECHSAYRKPINSNYRKENKAQLRKYDLDYRKKRIEEDDLYRARLIARDVIRKAISRGGYSKNSRTEEILGCDYATFKAHLESKFCEGMTWKNRNEWHVDHIIPISIARDERHLLELNHFTNLQPLWVEDNIRKSNLLES